MIVAKGERDMGINSEFLKRRRGLKAKRMGTEESRGPGAFSPSFIA